MVEKVKHTVPVIADLRSGTLTARHWDLLDDVLDVDIRTGDSVTFKQMIEVRSTVFMSSYFMTEARDRSTQNAHIVRYAGVWRGTLETYPSWLDRSNSTAHRPADGVCCHWSFSSEVAGC